ncbi:MAG: hypothetical protein ACLTXL_00875 [Clostridia bacterium]
MKNIADRGELLHHMWRFCWKAWQDNTSEAQATLLYAEDIHAHNTFETPEAVTPTAVHIDPARPFVIPKAAILAIRF